MRQTYENEKGELHREDGPALIIENRKYWYKNGNLHREDGPAVVYEDFYEAWYVDGIIHRENGPAAEYKDGRKYWFLNGEPLAEEEFNVKVCKIIPQETRQLTL